jgi:flagellar motor protein MotB
MSRRAESSRLRSLQAAGDGVDSEGSWAISYGDMVTLLLTFFILFFSTNRESQENSGLQAALLARLGADLSGKAEVQGKVDPVVDVGEQADQLGLDTRVIESWGGKARAMGSRIVVEFPETSFFNLSSTELTSEGLKALAGFTRLYTPYAGRNVLGIKAFTDTVAVDKARSRREGRKFDDNLELSAMRSISAMRSLQRSGIPLDRMRISGYGEFKLEMAKIAGRATAAAEASSQTPPKVRGNPLARKIVLVIEPETKEKL